MGIILMRTGYMVRAPTEDKTEQMLCRPPLTKRRLFSFQDKSKWRFLNMAFFTSAITTLQTLVVALGAGLGVWGVINLLEGYGNDNPGANAHVR